MHETWDQVLPRVVTDMPEAFGRAAGRDNSSFLTSWLLEFGGAFPTA